MSGRAGPGPSHANRISPRDGGNRGASKRRHGGADDSTSLSRKLTKLLRHSAKQRGLHIRPDGFVQLSEVLSLPEFRGLGIEQVRQIVAADNKQRYSLNEDHSDGVLIRANQGHSIQSLDEEAMFSKIVGQDQLPACVVHGTYMSSWPSIKEQGLLRMKRTHVHMAKGLPRENGVISGMRGSCEVVIHIDIRAAMAAGIEFYESANGVILSSEVPPRFFISAVHRKTGTDLLASAAGSAATGQVG